MEIDYDVAIVGAGPTGLTLANLLGLAGVRTLLIERNASTVDQPRAVSIDDESLRTLQATGLIDAVLADVALDYGLHYFTPSGVCFARSEPTTREFGFPRRSAFSQPLLEAALCKGLSRFDCVTKLFDHACENAEQGSHGVELTLVGPAGRRFTVTARYVVGADGSKSTLRKVIGAQLQGSSYDQRWLIVDLAETRERLRQTRVLCNPARPAITLPGPHGIRRYEFMLFDHESDEAAAAPEFARALLAAHGPDADAPVVRRQVYRFHARMVDRWRQGLIFLAGDAAHLSPPFAGQGMNSGVRDAHALAWRLVEVAQGRLGDGVLDSYEEERAPHAWALIQLAINIGRVMMPATPRRAFLVQSGFRIAGLLRPVHAYFAQMKYKPKPFYRSGFLVQRDGMDRVGRMLPQPRLESFDGSVNRLDDVMGNAFALIAYGPNAQARLASFQSDNLGIKGLQRLAILPMRINIDRNGPEIETAVRDVDDTLAPFMASGSDSLLLIRPDRYVMAAADAAKVDAVARFVSSVRELVDRSWAVVREPEPGADQLRWTSEHVRAERQV